MKKRSWVLVGLVASLVSACVSRDSSVIEPCVVTGFATTVRVAAVEKVDILFVVDNSSSMGEEQVALAAQLERMAYILTSGDIDGDSIADVQSVSDLHLAVISTDLGGAATAPVCSGPGDDGRLRNESSGSVGCLPRGEHYPAGPSGPAYLAFNADDPTLSDAATPEMLAEDFRCMAMLGIEGCGVEQPLDAMLKALAPSGADVPFLSGSVGRGDTDHEGFLRDDSLLAIIVVTDEDDCSIQDENIFATPAVAPFEGPDNTRCARYAQDALWPVSRYVDGLLSLRPDPSLVVFGAIVGVPLDLADTPPDLILADDRMTYRIDNAPPANGESLIPSCEEPGTGKAYPPRRIVEAALGLEQAGAFGVVHSICQDDFAPALDAVLGGIWDSLAASCLARPLTRDQDGLVDCDVVETLPNADMRCAEFADQGRDPVPVRTEADGREVCRVIQRRSSADGPPAEPGWYYDDASETVALSCYGGAPRVAYTEGAEPSYGVTVRLECVHAALDARTCEGDADCMGSTSGRVCDLATRTCLYGCGSNADCASGLVCDEDADTPVCRNPTCG